MYSNLQHIPNAGRLPELSNMPPVLRSSVSLLGQLASVDCVTTTILLREQAAVMMVTFASGQVPEYRSALLCFRGLHPNRIDINRDQGLMLLTIGRLAKA